jgi:hypothetical protein
MSVLVCVPSTDFRNCLAYRLGFFFNVDTDRSEAAGASRSCIVFIFTLKSLEMWFAGMSLIVVAKHLNGEV